MPKFIETEKGEVLNFDHALSLQKHEREDHAWIEAIFITGDKEQIAFSRNIEAIRESWFSLKEYLKTQSVYLLKKEIVEREVKNEGHEED
jgi:hypothetical protein